MLDVSGKPVVGYDRASRDSKGREISVQDQESDRAEFAEGLGITVEWKFQDPDMSAMPGAAPRPEWDAAMRVIQSGEAGGLQVWDTDRFSRDPSDVGRFVEKIRGWGLQNFKVYAGEDEIFNLSDDSDVTRFYEEIVAGAKEGFRIRKRTLRGMRKKRKRGEMTGGQHRRFGYIDIYEGKTHPEEKAALRDARVRILAGGNQAAIAREWNAAGLRTLDRAGNPKGYFTSSKVRDALRRPSLAGLIGSGSGKEWGRIKGDTVFTIEEYEEIVEFYEARRKKAGRPVGQTKQNPEHWANACGLVLCGRCGSRMSRETVKQSRKNPEKRYRLTCRYNPNRESRRGCYRAVRLLDIQNYLEGLVIDWWADPERGARDAEAIEAATNKKRILMERLGRVERIIAAADESYEATGDPEDWERIKKYQAKKKAIREELAATDETGKAAVAVDREKAIAMWKAANVQEKRNMARAAIQSVHVGEWARGRGFQVAFDPGRLSVVMR